MALCLCVMSVASALAQGENKNQISVSWGVGSMPEFRDFAITLGSLTDVEFNDQSGTIALQYLRFLNKKLGVGVLLGYERLSGVSNAMQDKTNLKDISENNLTLMPVLSAYWYRNRVVGIYSKVGAGGCYISRNNIDETQCEKNEMEFAYQVSLAGVDLGNEHIRGFVELGMGYQGIITLGVSYGF